MTCRSNEHGAEIRIKGGLHQCRPDSIGHFYVVGRLEVYGEANTQVEGLWCFDEPGGVGIISNIECWSHNETVLHVLGGTVSLSLSVGHITRLSFMSLAAP